MAAIADGTIRVLRNGYMSGHVRIPSADDVARFRAQFGWLEGAPVVGTVMRFVEQKDPDLWLDTAAEIAKARPEVRFLIAGYGELQDRIVRRIASLGLVDRVAMPGASTDVGLIYATLDVILLTSVIEGVPNVLIEAQACGRPVVALDVGGVSEAISQDRTGRVCPRTIATASGGSGHRRARRAGMGGPRSRGRPGIRREPFQRRSHGRRDAGAGGLAASAGAEGPRPGLEAMQKVQMTVLLATRNGERVLARTLEGIAALRRLPSAGSWWSSTTAARTRHPTSSNISSGVCRWSRSWSRLRARVARSTPAFMPSKAVSQS